MYRILIHGMASGNSTGSAAVSCSWILYGIARRSATWLAAAFVEGSKILGIRAPEWAQKNEGFGML